MSRAFQLICNLIKYIDEQDIMKAATTSSTSYTSLPKNVIIPTEMRAIIIDDNTKKLVLGTVPIPKLRSHEVLIKVDASAVNRADLLQAAGKYPPPKDESTIIGLECSGIIVNYSNDCTLAGKSPEFDIGSRIMALLPGGGYAQYVTVKETHLMATPSDLSPETAAAIPEAFLTAFQLLFWYGKPVKYTYNDNINDNKDNTDDNDVVLIHAGGSGVGTTLIQYCREYGLNAFITAGSKEKIDFCIKLGAKGGANYKTEEFDKKLLSLYASGANIVLDCVGASHWYKNLNSVAIDGRFVSYGFLSGALVKPLNNSDPTFSIVPILKKRISIIGTTLRSRSNDYKSKLIKDFTERIIKPLISTKRIKPIINKIFQMKDAQSAHDYVRSNANIGKVILTWDSSQCKL